MPNGSTDEHVTEILGRVNRAEKLVEHLIAEMEIYHGHKETTAHVWPPDWVPGLSLVLCPRRMAFLGLSVLWGLLHVYIRWQLRNRRAAAITQGGALRALAEWVAREPSNNDLERYSPEEKGCTLPRAIGARLATLLDYVFPFPWATLHYDVGKKNYPKWLGDALRQQEQDRTGAIKGEWLVTIGSFFIFFVTAVRTL